jgi:serine/threonine-protein phosphatase CPPED1
MEIRSMKNFTMFRLRKLIQISIIKMLIFCILPVNGFAQNRSSEHRPWFFIQITDPQFGMFENNEGFEKETMLYEKAVAEINRLKPDFVVITGDFVHNQHSHAQIEEFMRITAKVNAKIPVHYSPGNHDIGKNPSRESLRTYNKRFGKDRFSFMHKGSLLIGFNSGLIKSDSLPDEEQKQYNWLKSKLKKGRNKDHIILFSHYPFFIRNFDEPEAYSNLCSASRQKYLPLFDAHNVTAIFSGHYHNNALAAYKNIQLVTTSAVGKPLGKAPSGMRVVKIFQDKIDHEYYGLDELPDSILFD